MFSMTKRQWLAQFFRPVFAGTQRPREKRESVKRKLFAITVPGYRTTTFAAHTKGEARALAKRQYCFKDRLPAGTDCRCVGMES